ncbi:MAG: response regulator [Ilumatobacteraceae bacterium]
MAILLVDDTASKRLALRAVLTSLGHSIIEADSGRVAIRCVGDQRFAVIVLDVRMPIMNGIETAAVIRQNETSQHTPIIFVTAYETAVKYPIEPGEQENSEYMVMPVVPDLLRLRVSEIIDEYLASGVAPAVPSPA